MYIRTFAGLLLALTPLVGCAGGAFRSEVRPEPERRAHTSVAEDAVRAFRLPAGPLEPDWITDSIGGPYETLARVSALSAGNDAPSDALASMRRRVAGIGGNVMLVLDVRRHNAGPYTEASGYAYRALPPMPDAAARCARLLEPDSALSRIVACREAARQQPASELHRRGLLVAQLTHADLLARRGDGTAQAAASDARRAVARAWARDGAVGLSAAWVRDLVAWHHGDTARAMETIMYALLYHGDRGGALVAAREHVRLAPDSVRGYAVAFDALLGEGVGPGPHHRPGDAMAVAAAFARRQPERVEGWAWAALASHELGEHERAMRFWERVLEIQPRYFADRIMPPRGSLAYDHWRKRVPRQRPATSDDLP